MKSEHQISRQFRGPLARLVIETPPKHGTASISGDLLTYTPPVAPTPSDTWGVETIIIREVSTGRQTTRPLTITVSEQKRQPAKIRRRQYGR
jgi:hypothetical protein